MSDARGQPAIGHLAGLLITMGTLGDRIGRRRLLLIGAARFGAGSVLAAFSSTPAVQLS